MKAKKNKGSDSDDDDSQASNEINTDNSSRYVPIAKLGDKSKIKKIVINISDTQYPIVEQIAEELGWVIQKVQGSGDWDVWWTDRQIQPNTLFRMNLHQKINHFPGIYILARKNLLGLNLMGMRQYFPDEYDFFPETWMIPSQFSQFRHSYQSVQKGRIRTYIVKPEALSQGRGIFLTRNIEDIMNGNKYVIQRYLKNPWLIDKLKFDLRIYVLLAGTDPLRLYIYNEGLTRFATEQYQEPNNENLGRSYIHLTNYSLNKSNPNYIYNTSEKDMDKGHKRTLSSTYQRLGKGGIDITKLKLQIQDAIIKTVISGLPSIRHQYQYCQPQEYEGNMCFHILGFDVMITDDLKPIVIEVNHTPSFETGTPLDYLVKKNLIKDTLKLMRVTEKNKRKNFERAKQLAKIRLETGKRQIFKGKQRQQILLRARRERDELQKQILGGYKRIYPPQREQDEIRYDRFYDQALKLSRQDNQMRKRLLNDEKPKIITKKSLQKPQTIGCKGNQTQTNKSINQTEQNYRTLHNSIQNQAKHTFPVELKNQLKPEHLQNQIISFSEGKSEIEIEKTQFEGNKGSYLKQLSSVKQKRLNFRMKINKKHIVIESNNQLVKYTESVKQFNELMVKFMINNEQIPSGFYLNKQKYLDNETFLKIKQQLIDSRSIKNSSHNTTKLNPNPELQCNNIKDFQTEIRNGYFLKPTNYHITDQKLPLYKNVQQHKQQDKSIMREKVILLNQRLINDLIIKKKNSKAYQKLLSNPIIKHSFGNKK